MASWTGSRATWVACSPGGDELNAPAASASRGGDALLLSLCAAVILASALLTADLDAVYLLGRALPESCFFKRVFGLECLGCGLTRAFVLTAHLEPAMAFTAHKLGPLLWSAVAFQVPYRAWRLLRARRSVG